MPLGRQCPCTHQLAVGALCALVHARCVWVHAPVNIVHTWMFHFVGAVPVHSDPRPSIPLHLTMDVSAAIVLHGSTAPRETGPGPYDGLMD